MQCRAVVPDFRRPSATARAGAGPSGDSGRGRAAPRPRMRDRSSRFAWRFVGGSRNGETETTRGCVPRRCAGMHQKVMVHARRVRARLCVDSTHTTDPFATKSVTRYNCTGFLKCNLARHPRPPSSPHRLPRCGMPVRYVAGRFFRVRIPEETANRHQLSI